MTPWEFSVAMKGWARAHGAEGKPEVSYPSDDEYQTALERLH